MQRRAVLFDLDGTLTDSVGLIVHCCQLTIHTFLQCEVPHEEIAPQVGRSLFALFEEYDATQRPEMVVYYRERYAELHDAWVRLFPACVSAPGVVTSKTRASAWPALTRFELVGSLQTLVTYDDTEDHKPHPAPLLLAAEQLRVAPEQCWYVGDAIHEMHAAQAAGMVAVGALWGASEPERLQVATPLCVESPIELLPLLQGR